MKRSIIALTLVFVFLLAGCSEQPVQNADGVPHVTIVGSPGQETIPTEELVACQCIPESVENPNGLPVLKWVCLVDDATLYSAHTKAWTEEVGADINQALAEREMPFRLQIVLLTAKGYFYDWLADPIAVESLPNADLIYGFFYPDQAAEVFQPITEYIAGDNALLSGSVADEIYWKTDMLDGEIYGIQGTISYPISLGWICEDKTMTALGLSPEDITMDYWQMDAVFADMYEANEQQPFLHINQAGVVTNDMVMTCLPAVLANHLFYRYQWITACYSIDYSLNTPTVVNSLDTDYTHNLVAAMQRYKTAGYTLSDAEEGSVCIQYGSVYVQTPGTFEGVCYVPVERPQYMTVYGNFLNGVAKNSEQRENAVALLKLIAQDEEFRRLICFGRDGVEYTVQDGVAIFHESTSFYNMYFLSGMSDFSGLNTGSKVPLVEGETPLETYQSMMNNSVKRYPLLVGYGFDISGIMTEIEAVNKVVKNNADFLLTMTEEEYDQFIADIRDAGGDKIQAELQRQLDEWLAANPDWQCP